MRPEPAAQYLPETASPAVSRRKVSLGPHLKKHEAVIGLAYVALIWGTTFPLVRIAVEHMGAELFVALRFTVAALVLGFYLWMRGRFRAFPTLDFVRAVGVGFVIAVVYLAQTIGLKTVSAPRAAFLTGANMLFVPLCTLVRGRRPSSIEVLSALVAFVGLFFLADPFGDHPEIGLSSIELSSGDLWILLCALFVAIQLHLVKAVTQRGTDPAMLAFGQIVGVMLFAWGTVSATDSALSVPWSWKVLGILVFCSIGVSLAAFYLHSRYQRGISPEKTALIFGLEPVSAAFFGFLILGETLTTKGLLGASLMLLALMVPALIPKARAAPDLLTVSLTKKPD